MLVRHGKSEWNVKNVFTGWTDVDLAPEGVAEAKKAGELIKSNGINVDVCFSSYLKRAIRTAWIMLETAEMMFVDCHYSWKLNERHYGDWQGRNKDEVRQEVGEEYLMSVRRGYDTPPPRLAEEDKRHPKFDATYRKVDPARLPVGESLKDTKQRVVNYFFEAIAPSLAQDKAVLVSAHGNSLRALIEYIEHISSTDIVNLEVATGVPHLYEFDTILNLVNHYPLP